jgi:hypothetical protein
MYACVLGEVTHGGRLGVAAFALGALLQIQAVPEGFSGICARSVHVAAVQLLQ